MRFGLRMLLAIVTYFVVAAGLLVIVADQSPAKLPGMLAVISMFGGLALALRALRPR